MKRNANLRVEDYTSNSYKNVVSKARTSSSFRFALRNAIELLKIPVSDIFVSNSAISRSAAIISVFCLLLFGSTNIFPAEWRIVGTVLDPTKEMTWDQFRNETKNTGSTFGNTYILTGNVGTPTSSISSTPVSSLGGVSCPFDGGLLNL